MYVCCSVACVIWSGLVTGGPCEGLCWCRGVLWYLMVHVMLVMNVIFVHSTIEETTKGSMQDIDDD